MEYEEFCEMVLFCMEKYGMNLEEEELACRLESLARSSASATCEDYQK